MYYDMVDYHRRFMSEVVYVRQGGINSPWFFNLCINDLIVKLRNSGYGCYIFLGLFRLSFFR